ncbi:MAG: hypothetical protein RBU37_23975 [Myxococcota bacterium]|jgi:cysteine-rich repeat protein|nr:hypothetical protein [Myxococcota bacterium]
MTPAQSPYARTMLAGTFAYLLLACSSPVSELLVEEPTEILPRDTAPDEQPDAPPDQPLPLCEPACAEGIPCRQGVCGDVLQLSVGSALNCALMQSKVSEGHASSRHSEGTRSQEAESRCEASPKGARQGRRATIAAVERSVPESERMKSGEVYCWLRDLSRGVRLYQVLGVEDAVEVHTSGRHGCVLNREGSVACWGDDQSGSLRFDPEFDFLAKPIPELHDATGLAVGERHACALLADGRVGCWGQNSWGQLGRAPLSRDALPFAYVEELSDVRLLAAGSDHTCAILADGGVRCWGWNFEGQLGHEEFREGTRALPVAVSDAVALSLGALHSCMLDSAQRVWCWGNRAAWGQTFDPERNSEPMELVSLRGAVSVAVGRFHTCTLGEDGRVRCLGSNTQGECKHDDPTPWKTEANANSIDGARALAAGFDRSCALLDDGSVHCWGRIGPPNDGSLPSKVDGLPKSEELRVGGEHSCAKGSDGTWRCWGTNFHGQLGIEEEWSGEPRLAPMPTKVSEGHASSRHSEGTRSQEAESRCEASPKGARQGRRATIVAVERSVPESERMQDAELVLGRSLSCAREADGSVWCWGLQGMAFYDDQAAMPTPTRIDGMPPSEGLFVGSEHACSLSHGEVWCWGGNSMGQAVPGEGMVLTQATRLPTELRFRELSLGYLHSCGLTDDGELYCWGDDSSGQLGREPLDEHSVAQVLGLEALRSVVVGGEHSCVLAADERVYCMGANRRGVLGTGDFLSSWEPRASVVSGVEVLVSGYYAMYALMDDGRVLSWGSGALGDGVGGQRSKPVQVAGLEEVLSIGAGSEHACALTKAGEVWCWGSNEFGMLGWPLVQRRVEVTGLASRGCGDGLLHSGEGCDDGNREAGDGCDSACQVEEGWRCERTQGCLRLRAGDSCEQAIALSLPSELEGSFEGFVNDYKPSSGGCTHGQATGADLVFRLEVQAGASLRVSAQSELDVVLYVSTGCPDVLGACILGSDEGVAGELEQVTLHNDLTEAQTYYFVVDSYVWASEPHGFWLQVEEVE